MISDELKKALRTKVCQATGIHNYVPYKPGTMICSGCGIFAKVGAMYMQTGDPEYLLNKGVMKNDGRTIEADSRSLRT